MKAFLPQVWRMLIGRSAGPLALRFLAQPTMAGFLGIQAGLRDARAGHRPYGWRLLTETGHRWRLLREGWQDVSKLFVIATVLDFIYEIIVYRWIYPVQALIIAAAIALPSYVVVRGLANRIARSVGICAGVTLNPEGKAGDGP